MTDYSRAELLAKPIWAVLPVVSAPNAQQGWNELIAGEPRARLLGIVRKDGRTIPVNAAFTPHVMPHLHAATLAALH